MFPCQQQARYGPGVGAVLNDDETARWVAWKRAADAVTRRVAADIAAATGLSGADFSVLTRLVEDGGGRLRQQRLADDLEWERSRLSRHLGRMETRGLLTRDPAGAERWIEATGEGRRLAAEARIIHADAVRRHLLVMVPREESAAFWRTVRAMAALS
jgi:DNA-binding MarR family transcriptional regulator